MALFLQFLTSVFLKIRFENFEIFFLKMFCVLQDSERRGGRKIDRGLTKASSREGGLTEGGLQRGKRGNWVKMGYV